jgi:ABC-2 type transport system ATP-binding protein
LTEAVIIFDELTKVYGKDTVAVDGLSASVMPGRVTGFLGPNGAGKSTALRCLLGLVTPTSGSGKINGLSYQELVNPIKTVGALLDSRGFHPGLTALQNLKIISAAAGISETRIPELLELVDLSYAKNKRTKGFSLGMKQRLSLAIALLGDPEILVLDEPANGLDPQGIAWLRNLLKQLASQGRTVLVSSHQLLEMQNTVDDVIIINKGKLVITGSISEVCGNKSLEETFLQLTTRGDL